MSESTYKILSFPGKDLPTEYKGLVFSKWLRSLRYGNQLFKLMDSISYFQSYHHYIENLLQKPDSKISLAVLSEDKDVVLGFSVHRGRILDYIHVHQDQREHGIGNKLLPKDIREITHITKLGTLLWKKKHPDWKFNPFA